MRYALRSDTVPRAASGLCVCGCLRPSCGLDDELVSLTCRITLGLSALEFIEHRHKRCRFDTTYHYLIRRPVGQPQPRAPSEGNDTEGRQESGAQEASTKARQARGKSGRSEPEPAGRGSTNMQGRSSKNPSERVKQVLVGLEEASEGSKPNYTPR